jgi:uncharacterized protein
MTVTTSFPGVYIQEVPLSTHAIVPAPTSIAAFVGYSHPYKTARFGYAQRIFSFSDYETYFGGLFSSGMIDASLPRAVYQFFLNGGSDAYVVGLQPGLFKNDGTLINRLGAGDAANNATLATTGGSMVFTALEPTDVVPITVTVTNVRTSRSSAPVAKAVFDLVITFGSQVETFRGASLDPLDKNFPDTVVNGKSGLITVAKGGGGGGWGTAIGAATSATLAYPTPAAFFTGFHGADFQPVFDANSSLDNVEIFNLLMTPGVADNAVVSEALAFAERKRAFAIVDPPPQAPAFGVPPPATIDQWMTGLGGPGGYTLPKSQNGALYFPYLTSTDLVTGLSIPMPPSGFVAGIYAQTDASRGVWKAPAGLATTVLNTAGPVPSGRMNDPQQGVLNLDSVNCLRSFSGIGTVVWGARTLVANNQAFAQSMYVPVRRMTLFIEQTLLANLRWAVFEPNDEPLWTAIRASIEAFLLSLFRQGGLQGSTPSEAFQVRCDANTTTPTDQQNGIVNILVAFAPLKPAEFVVIQIAQLAGQSAS